MFFKITVPDDHLLHLTGRQDAFFLTGYQLTVVGDAEIVVLQDVIYTETDEGLFTGFVRADLHRDGITHMGAGFYRDGCPLFLPHVFFSCCGIFLTFRP